MTPSALAALLPRARDQRPLVMGILNLTPDSFSDGGELLDGDALDLDALLSRAETMVADGAAILDVGAESTRPGARGIEEGAELERVGQALEALRARFDVALSVDTSTPAVMRLAASAGAAMINDVRALRREGALAAAAATDLLICLMHMQGEPGSMQDDPRYGDVVTEVGAFLDERVTACVEAGIDRQRLVLDPGVGFGKLLDHNLALLSALPELARRGLPLLVGVSRKRMIGELTGRALDGRLAGSLAAALAAAQRGAMILRVHDVGPTVDALKVMGAIQGGMR